MAQLPNSDYLIQMIGDEVVIFHRHTEEELVRFPVNDRLVGLFLGPFDRSLTVKCVFCGRDIGKCRMDRRGFCVKSPLSDGVVKRRTKKERESDKRARG